MLRAAVRSTVLFLPALAASCSTLRYDLATVPFPVAASPAAAADGPTERFEASGKQVLWVHGLFGTSQPDVAALVVQRAGAATRGVADFRVTSSATFHDWLITHLTLGFVRMKTVTVSGVRMLPRP
jgi:hypothetical protein